MKFFNSLFLFGTLFMSQIFSAYALPIDKRGIRPFQYLNTFIYFKKPDHWNKNVNAYLYEEGKDSKTWPGRRMSYNEEDNFYHLPLENHHFIDNEKLRVIFNDGEKKHQAPAVMQEGFKVIMDGVYDETGIIGITNEKPNPVYYDGVKHLYYNNGLIRILYRPEEHFFDTYDVYAHYKIGNGNWNNVPGDKLTGYWSGFYYINIDVHDAEELTIAFTDGEKWDNNEGKNYHFNKFDNTLIDNNHGINYIRDI
eukprot:jgi/Orpsp1_1/1177746/evm.model.c7180000062662.2